MSSEALERAQAMRGEIEDAMHWIGGTAVMAPGSRRHSSALAGVLLGLEALLADVASLEQERDASIDGDRRAYYEGRADERAEMKRVYRDFEQRAQAAEAALAVAREREQRAVEALGGLVAATERAVTLLDAHDSWLPEAEALSVALRAARAALVEEPAAATTRECPNCNGFGKVQDSVRVEPVTCGRCDGHGLIPATTLAGPDERPGGAAVTRSLDADTQSRLLSPASGSASAAADEPAHKRPASSDGMGRTPQGGRATQDPEIGASPAAADEPGETP